MNAATLKRAMERPWSGDRGISLARANELIAACNEAMLQGGVVTRERAAMFLAQIGHESVSLVYKAEIGKGRGRPYPPYYGRGFIQLTWGSNYKSFGQWAKGRGLVTDANVFFDHPELVEQDRWAWLSAMFFWVDHSNLNVASDRRDVKWATRIINGGYNGLDDRTNRYHHIMLLGDAILPSSQPTTPGGLSVTDVAKILAAQADTNELLSLAIRGDRAPAGTPEAKQGNETHPANLVNIKAELDELRAAVLAIKAKIGA